MRRFLLLLLLVAATAQAQDYDVAVRRQLAERPASTLIDLYKSFMQDALGPGHLIADTAAARRYLRYELAEATEPQSVEPCGTGRTYVRAPLSLIREGRISEDAYFRLFLQGLRPVSTSDLKAWRTEWRAIQRTIDRLHLSLPHYRRDRRTIRRALRRGHYALHHSQAYNQAYHPHYRIMRRTLLHTALPQQ